MYGGGGTLPAPHPRWCHQRPMLSFPSHSLLLVHREARVLYCWMGKKPLSLQPSRPEERPSGSPARAVVARQLPGLHLPVRPGPCCRWGPCSGQPCTALSCLRYPLPYVAFRLKREIRHEQNIIAPPFASNYPPCSSFCTHVLAVI